MLARKARICFRFTGSEANELAISITLIAELSSKTAP